jgi:DNA helicase II / ATP-dependent DNA helicase PcrA
VLAYLKLLSNPSDEISLLRAINTPPRGIGPTALETLLKSAVARGVPLYTVLSTVGAQTGISPLLKERVDGFRRLIDTFRARLGGQPLHTLMADLVRTIGYRGELERVYKTPGEIEARWASVEELVNAIGHYEARAESPSLLGFLEESTLTGDDYRSTDRAERHQHAVTLMTLHSAKGLEFPHVYMVGMEEGILPHHRSIAEGNHQVAEERRLCYVGVTRAEETLTLTSAKTRMKWGRPQATIISRFLPEMRGESQKAEKIAEAFRLRHATVATDAGTNGGRGRDHDATERNAKSRPATRSAGVRSETTGSVPRVNQQSAARAKPKSTAMRAALERKKARNLESG